MTISLSEETATKMAELVSDTGEPAEALVSEAINLLYIQREYDLCFLKVNVRGYGEYKKAGETVRLPAYVVTYLVDNNLAVRA